MSKVLVTDTHLTNIANAIRSKNGESTVYKPAEMAAAIAAIPTGITPTGTVDITQNGTTDVTQYANANVNVPNSYAAADEGKVVQSGALVAQTARSGAITQNGTYDTTNNNAVTVNVSGGGGGLPSGVLVGTSAPTSADGNNGDSYWQYAELGDTVRTGSANAGFDSDYEYYPSDTAEVRFMLNQLTTDSIYIWSSAYSPSRLQGIAGFGFNSGAAGSLACMWSASKSSSIQEYDYADFTKLDCLNKPVTLRLEGNQVYLNGTLIKTFSGTPDTASLEAPLCFFAYHTSSGYTCPGTYVSLEYLKIWDSNGNLVRHYLPYDDNGTAKLRDSVTQSVYGPSNTSALSLDPARKIVGAQYVKSGGIWLPL